ncbi:GNAT family N-acetyltransferase [Sphingobacterium kitahiroshimense]|uniref:GNAT family N-acetyltransferase n=1 Tax=Sphingobacterium sp. B16(2022) TaxID=2914044 RepID=UPI00143AD720|nr:GNAT family N-acetyltransferase [Sphingobacterium sp. B16(2022)]NJI73258.1 GNAT family N-acetyltransferase [Sphingobacterium sp. B16(2022)]
MGTIDFIIAKTKDQIIFCKNVLFAFRTNLDEATYIDQIQRMIAHENFKLVYIPNEDNTKVAAFIGYRVMNTLRTGRMIYIDDLYTNPEHRGRGYARALLDYVDEEATKTDIASVHLDSGYTLYDAHRLYLNKGYVLACNHFAKTTVLSL